MAYNSVEDILESMTKEDMKNELTKLGVEYHHNNTAEKLAGKIFEVKGADPKSSKQDGISFEDWESKVEKIKKHSDSVKKSKQKENKMYVAKFSNYHESPTGVSLDGETIRYVQGYHTLSIEEQRKQGDVFRLERIKFKNRGDEKEWTCSNGFKGRSMLQTRDEWLQKYLESNKSFNQRYALYDENELTRREMADDRKLTGAKAAVYGGDRNHLIATISWLEMAKGNDVFDSLVRTTDENVLEKRALKYVKANVDSFLEAMNDKKAQLMFMVNKAKKDGFIKVTSDGSQVKWANNNQTICTSSVSENWQFSMLNLILSDKGQNLFERLKDMTGVYVKM